MAKFRIDSLAEFARQIGFAPYEVRLTQLAAAEELLLSLDPAKAYPLDFIVYRITGYRPKKTADDLLSGGALQHDLGLLIEQVSCGLQLRVEHVNEPVLRIEDLTGQLNITSKTIQRWRRKGLPGRRLIFADGRARVGFLLSRVERYLATHAEPTDRAARTGLVAGDELQRVVAHARRLAGQSRCCITELTRRVGRMTGRSAFVILHLLQKHDHDHPSQAVLPLAPEPMDSRERTLAVRLRRQGMCLSAISRRLRRPRTMVHRAILQQRIARLARRKMRFIDDPLYHDDDAERMIGQIAAQQPLDGPIPLDESRVPPDLPPYLRELYRWPLLSAVQEKNLFLELNFHKYRFVSARRRTDPELARVRDLRRLEALLARVIETKNRIVQANLRLVVSVARKHLRPGMDLMELVSEGNLVLLRAVDSFDTHTGNRFSTYATLALMKGFARSVPQMQAARIAGTEPEALADLPAREALRIFEQISHRDQVRTLLSSLDERERTILRACYGLGESSSTYEQLGQRLGLSRQRVRQIERGAVEKLRSAARATRP
jgi:RNA polymerase primary sigma factor